MRAPLPLQLRHVVTRWWSKLIGFYVLPPALRSKSFCNRRCLFPWVIDVNLPPDLNGEQMDLTHGLNFFPTGQFSRADKGENALKDENHFQIGRCDLVVNVCFRWIILLYAAQRDHCFIIAFWLGIVLNLSRGDRVLSNWRHIALFRAMGRSKRSYLDFILLFICAQSIPCQMIKDNLCRVTVQRKPLAWAVDQLQLQRLRVSVSAAAASHSKQQNHRLALRAKAHTVIHNCVEKYSRVRQRGKMPCSAALRVTVLMFIQPSTVLELSLKLTAFSL